MSVTSSGQRGSVLWDGSVGAVAAAVSASANAEEASGSFFTFIDWGARSQPDPGDYESDSGESSEESDHWDELG